MLVGTKELKNRLSHYLRLVREGERVLVTDRGIVVAELRPAKRQRRDEDVWLELERKGVVTIGRGRLRDVEPIQRKKRGLVSRMIIEDRG